jgi:hypothetical protein
MATNPNFELARKAKLRKAVQTQQAGSESDLEWQGIQNNRFRYYLQNRKREASRDIFNPFYFGGIVL